MWDQTSNLIANDKIKSHGKNLKDEQTLYHLNDVSVKFDKLEVLESIYLTINVGEIVFITGPSGAGKTTLLRVLNGNIRPNCGKINGPDFLDKDNYISFIHQDLKLIEEWTCWENLELTYDSQTYSSKKQFNKELKDISRIFQIEDKLKMKVAPLNGGLKQIIAIIRSLLTRPKIILADEPTSALDSEKASKVFEIFKFYNERRGVTILWASHNKELVRQFSGRIIHLERGRLIYSGHACFI